MASAARKAAATQKGRPAAMKAATTRKRRSGGKKAATAPSMPAVVPMISYEDGIAAMEWLRTAFGFRETTRLTTPDGTLSHGEMAAGNGLIMLASPTPEYRSPKRHREVCEQARKWSTVKAAGATILSAIEEGPPGRRYRSEDLEGHRWFFFEADHV